MSSVIVAFTRNCLYRSRVQSNDIGFACNGHLVYAIMTFIC